MKGKDEDKRKRMGQTKVYTLPPFCSKRDNCREFAG